MRNLLDFLAKYNHWFIFILLEVISFVLLFQFNSYQGSVWFSSANAVTGKVYEAGSEIGSYFQLSKINEQLTQRNLFLEQRLSELHQQMGDSVSDSILENSKIYKSLQPYRLISAKVISNSIDRKDNLMTINKGEADGVKKDMGVVSGNGVVGIVYLTSAHYSVIIPVLNLQSNISCVIQGRGYFGYLHWTGGDASQAYVVTSGYSSVFPPGIMVGQIRHVFNSADQMSYRLKVKLSTDFGKLRDVCVIDNRAMAERLQILRAAQDSIKSKDEK
jgi:rod shape-determining protein MreC